MQGLITFASALGDAIAVMLIPFCYIAACVCFVYFVWGLRNLAEPRHRGFPYRAPMWAPWISLMLSGVFATFPQFLNMANVSAGFPAMIASVTSYTPTIPPSANNILGSTPDATVIDVVVLFQHFFQLFGAACVFWAIWSWRAIINGTAKGSMLGCGIQMAFGVLLINIVAVATNVTDLFETGG